MTKESQLKSPFVEFDYNDDTRHSSRIKQGILYMVRIQGVFDQLGQLDLTPDVVSFIREPHIREKLEDIVKGESRFSLTSPELPFLMRAELVDAYFQYKISQHLQQFDGIEVYLTEGERQLFAKPVGTEVVERLGRDADETLKQKIMQSLASGTHLDIYDGVFDGEFGKILDIAAAFLHQAGTQVSTALVPHVSSELTVSHLGGRDAINSTLFFHALFRSQPASEKEKAIYYDSMRRILQVDGKLPETGRYCGITLSLEAYNSIPEGFRRVIHDYLIRNFMDAQKIQEVATIFPGEIDKSIGGRCVIGGLIEAGNIGVRMDDENRFYFDNDSSKSLESVAMGAQYLLEKLAECSDTALVPLSVQSGSDRRRSRNNVGFFQMFSGFGESKMYWERELPEFTASNVFELFGIEDSKEQQEFYNAYLRLFGSKGFEGRGEEPWDKVMLKLESDGRMQMAMVDDLHGRDENVDWFNPFEYLKTDDRGVEYTRRTEFDPNIDRLRESVVSEIASNRKVREQLALATQRECPVRVDEGLYHQMQYIRETLDELAKWDERVVVLLPFVQQDYTAHMETLGIDELRDRSQVSKAYHQAVRRDEAHPDLTQDPTEKIVRGRRLNELIRARDELVHKLDLQSASSAYGVSMYIGNVSTIFHNNQSPASQ